MGIDVGQLGIEVLLEPDAKLDGMSTPDPSEIVIEAGDLLLVFVTYTIRAAEVCQTTDGDHRAGPGKWVSHVMFIAIGPGAAKLIEQSR